jgi:hypothetical protein
MSLPKDKRHSTEQAAEFAKKTVEQNEFQASRRDPYERVMAGFRHAPASENWNGSQTQVVPLTPTAGRRSGAVVTLAVGPEIGSGLRVI